MLRFGGPVFLRGDTKAAGVGESHGAASDEPEELVRAHRIKGFSAAYAPKIGLHETEKIKAYRTAFEEADILIAEVGYWENLLDLDQTECRKNRARMVEALALAEALGACCSINILGSYCRGHGSSQHSGMNFSDEAFQAAVEISRRCIDDVKPKIAFFVYEIFPFNVVDSPETISAVVKAVDRKQFGVHMDIVNLINCPRKYFDSAGVIRQSVALFGERIVSAHIKDIKMREPAVSVILEEVLPGLGGLDIAAYLRALDGLPHTVPLLMEHLTDEREYDLAARHIRDVADAERIRI